MTSRFVGLTNPITRQSNPLYGSADNVATVRVSWNNLSPLAEGMQITISDPTTKENVSTTEVKLGSQNYADVDIPFKNWSHVLDINIAAFNNCNKQKLFGKPSETKVQTFCQPPQTMQVSNISFVYPNPLV